MKTGIGLVDYAQSKVGTPYFYGAKMQILTEDYMQKMHKQYPSVVTLPYIAKARLKKQVGKVNVDCSGLIGAYRQKQIGSYQLYQQAYARLPISDWNHFANGVVLWRKGHVGVFWRDSNGDCSVIEAKGINYGVVVSDFDPTKWSYGLTFSDLEYVYDVNIICDATWREVNPYTKPTRVLKKGCTGDDVRWLQFELEEAGFKEYLEKHGGIDGKFGNATLKCVKEFQRSCKLEVDGHVGKLTRTALEQQ